jgi:hypothetical protein
VPVRRKAWVCYVSELTGRDSCAVGDPPSLCSVLAIPERPAGGTWEVDCDTRELYDLARAEPLSSGFD